MDPPKGRALPPTCTVALFNSVPAGTTATNRAITSEPDKVAVVLPVRIVPVPELILMSRTSPALVASSNIMMKLRKVDCWDTVKDLAAKVDVPVK